MGEEMMILELTLFTCAFAGLVWATLVAHNRGIGEPFAMVGRALLAFGLALEWAHEQFRIAYAAHHADLVDQFPASKQLREGQHG